MLHYFKVVIKPTYESDLRVTIDKISAESKEWAESYAMGFIDKIDEPFAKQLYEIESVEDLGPKHG